MNSTWEVSESGPFFNGQHILVLTVLWLCRGWDKPVEPMVYDGTNLIHAVEKRQYLQMIWPEATTWMKQLNSVTPEKPFFLYFAPGATHASPCTKNTLKSIRGSLQMVGKSWEKKLWKTEKWGSYHRIQNNWNAKWFCKVGNSFEKKKLSMRDRWKLLQDLQNTQMFR